MATPYLGTIGEFNPEAGSSVKLYLERMNIFFSANNVPTVIFLSVVGETTYNLLKVCALLLCQAAKPINSFFFRFHKHAQAEGESIHCRAKKDGSSLLF